MRLTAFTIVFGDHVAEGGGALLAPAPSDAGDLAAGRDIFSASTALYALRALLLFVWLLGSGLVIARCSIAVAGAAGSQFVPRALA